MRPRGVVVGGVPDKNQAQMPLTEDQHPVGDLGSHCQDEAFGEAVRARTARRNFDHLDTRVRQDLVERRRELPGPIADEEPEPVDVLAEVHQQVAGLLGGPRSVRMCGHSQHVHVAVADLEPNNTYSRRNVSAQSTWKKSTASNSPCSRWYPQRGFSRAIRTTKSARTSSIGGRPVRFG